MKRHPLSLFLSLSWLTDTGYSRRLLDGGPRRSPNAGWLESSGLSQMASLSRPVDRSRTGLSRAQKGNEQHRTNASRVAATARTHTHFSTPGTLGLCARRASGCCSVWSAAGCSARAMEIRKKRQGQTRTEAARCHVNLFHPAWLMRPRARRATLRRRLVVAAAARPGECVTRNLAKLYSVYWQKVGVKSRLGTLDSRAPEWTGRAG